MKVSKKKVSNKKNPTRSDYKRGHVKEVKLKKPFTFNGENITTAIIEIDHINYGLNKKVFKLNATRRSNFTISDIEKFLSMLDGEYIAYSKINGRKLRFEIRIDSPIPGKNYGKTYILIFETNYDKPAVVHTITLFPNW